MLETMNTSRQILVINPNSSEVVSAAIDAALRPLRLHGGPTIRVETLAEGPPGISTQRDVEQVVLPLCGLISRSPADAFVISCFSDPGLLAAREAANGRSVFGIAECGLLTALTLGERFGIIAIVPASARRQQRYVRSMGLQDRYVGSLSVSMSAAAVTEGNAFESLKKVGERLRDERGADVLVLGCAGMAAHRKGLEDAIGLPIVEPSQAAVVMAIGAVCIESAQ